MKQLYEAKDRIEAQLLKDYLDFYNIETVILGDYLSGAAGQLEAIQFPHVWLLEDADEARGRTLLQEFLEMSANKDKVADWTCSNCGEVSEGQFEHCWQCGTRRNAH